MSDFLLLLLLICLITLSLSGCSSSDQEAMTTWEKIEAAYIYSYPLVMVEALKKTTTNTEEVTNNRAPINQMIHGKNLVDASFVDVVTPNTDTIYSQAFLDLTDTALVLVKPKVDRFAAVQMMDAYTNTIKVLGSGETQDEQTYLLTGPDFDGSVPDNMEQVAFPQNMGWVLIRVLCKGIDDLENIYAIQNQLKIMPLDAYQDGGDYTAPKGVYNPDNDFVAGENVVKMSPQAFFDAANRLLTENPPPEMDNGILKTISSINVGPGKTFDPAILGEEREAKWKDMLTNLPDTLGKESKFFAVEMGQWSYWGEPIADFGTEYEYRALVALAGLGANPVVTAIYPKVEKDSDGNSLNGNSSYTIHFGKDGLPQTRKYGFWSITAYNSKHFLIDNILNRYSINDRSDLKFNGDGSLDILLQIDPPEDLTMENNWLPISMDDFHLHMRIYLPAESVLDGDWTAPRIGKTSSAYQAAYPPHLVSPCPL